MPASPDGRATLSIEDKAAIFLYISFYYVRRPDALLIQAIRNIRSMYSDQTHFGGAQ